MTPLSHAAVGVGGTGCVVVKKIRSRARIRACGKGDIVDQEMVGRTYDSFAILRRIVSKANGQRAIWMGCRNVHEGKQTYLLHSLLGPNPLAVGQLFGH